MSHFDSDYFRARTDFVQWVDRLSSRARLSGPLQKSVRREAKRLEARIQSYKFPLINHPGWLNPRTTSAFLQLRDQRVPFRQACALDSLLRVDHFHQSIGAVSVLNAGTLLGAVRQGAFAGRPGDIDLYVIYEKGIDAYLSAVRAFGGRHRIFEAQHKCTSSGPAKLKIRAPIGVDVLMLVHNPAESATLCPDRVLPRDRVQIAWPGRSAALTAQVFGREFAIPSNYVDVLTRYYGSAWTESTSRQFAVRQPTISHPISEPGGASQRDE